METWLVVGKTTTLNAVGLAVLGMGILSVLFMPRKLIAVVFVVIACFTTVGQQIVVASFSFDIPRLMIAATLIRASLRMETGPGIATKLDKALLSWVVLGALIYSLRIHTVSAITNQVGRLYDVIGLFYVFRFSIREFEDLHTVVRALAITITVLMLLMSVERITGHNPFAVLGGVPEHTMIREGRFRAQGPFRHPILAGTLAATSIPMFVAIWHGNRSGDRLLSVLGIFSSFTIVALTASSSPLISSATAVLSVLLWPHRKKTKSMWYLFLIGIFALQAVMKAPVWYLFAKAGNMLGGTGWHRAFLMDQAIRYFRDWWIAGTAYTANWMPYQLAINPNSADITNQFLVEGVNGGIFTLCAFVAVVTIAFRTLAKASRIALSDSWGARIVWALWGSLLAHVVTFFSLSYFDQMNIFWYMLLAGISLVLTKISPASQESSESMALRFSPLTFGNRSTTRSLGQIQTKG